MKEGTMELGNRRLLGSLIIIGSLVAGLSLSAAEPAVEFDHLNGGAAASYLIEVGHGQPFVITIKNTLPDRFNYEIEAIPVSATLRFGARNSPNERDLKTHQLVRTHDKQFGGYIVHITNKGLAVEVTMNDGTRKPLPNATLIINVKTLEWDYETSGAFTVTGLRDRVFALEKRTENNVESQYVIRDHSAEDSQDLGIGAFINVFHTGFPLIGATFGLGVNDGNRTTYFAGPSIRLGNKAAITLGLAAGSVSRLPAGVSVGDKVTDPNVLNNAGTRIDRSWFVGFSYTFLNPGNALQKPFAGLQSTPQPPAPATPAGGGGDDDDDEGEVDDNGGNNNNGNGDVADGDDNDGDPLQDAAKKQPDAKKTAKKKKSDGNEKKNDRPDF